MDIKILEETQENIKDNIYTELVKFQIDVWVTKEPVSYNLRKSGEYKKLSIGESWGDELFDCAWFEFSCIIPDEYIGEKLFAFLDINGEMLIVDHIGEPVEGLTNQNSVFDENLGKPGKTIFQLPESLDFKVELWADAGLNDLFGQIQDDGKIKQASLVSRNENLYQLWFDFTFCINLLGIMDSKSELYHSLKSELQKVTDILDIYSDVEILECKEILKIFIYNNNTEVPGDSLFKISAIGHAHLDLAWLWPLRETVRKGARTFATALRSMERDPDYIFGASQPQLYYWIKQSYPSIYEQIKKRVKDGRWELLGGLWVECDLNLISSESMIRQLLYGIRFFQNEFDIKVKNVMLPDAFGFSAAFPQIMSGAGIEYFITMKPKWNLINTFPYHSFIWKGIDGSEIPTHILPEGTYNGAGTASSIRATMDNYKEIEVSDYALILFGIGDGGGGPGTNHLESLKRAKQCEILPSIRQETIDTFYSRWITQCDNFPIWNDEIYLERHQGTFTSQAKIKKMNRSMELTLKKYELLSVVCYLLNREKDIATTRDILEEVWKETLLFQFHDILPGSSIKRVYDEVTPRYEKNLQKIDSLIFECYNILVNYIDVAGKNSSEILFNYSNFTQNHWYKSKESWAKIQIPALGFFVYDSNIKDCISIPTYNINKDVLENDLLKITFCEEGWISSIIYKESGLEILSPLGSGNLLSIYQDDGDCWDFPLDYRKKLLGKAKLQFTNFIQEGPTTITKQRYSFGNSIIDQEIKLNTGSYRIDFVTSLDWKEAGKMLRTSFDVDVLSKSARYEIQGGFIERPTHNNNSWDRAKEEVPAHSWADLSQKDRGVALLNDCKYGYRVKGNTMELNLIRSGKFPHVDSSDSYTDLEKHEFTYSLYPHKGDDLIQVIKEATFLNNPAQTFVIKESLEKKCEQIINGRSFFSVDKECVNIQSVKFSEDDNSIIIRLNESIGGETDCYLSSFKKPVSVKLCDLLESEIEDIKITTAQIPLKLKPFQIVTLKVVF